jgi:hypothetical protein
MHDDENQLRDPGRAGDVPGTALSLRSDRSFTVTCNAGFILGFRQDSGLGVQGKTMKEVILNSLQGP